MPANVDQKFVMQNLRFDDVASNDRKQRKEEDKMYCFRESFEDFSRQCQENYSHSAHSWMRCCLTFGREM